MRFKPGSTQALLSARQSGSALIYILIAVALLAALTVSLMEPANQQAQTQSTTNLVSTIDSQVKFISSTIQECVLSHPNQDTGLTTQQANAPYPINPTDNYYPVATPPVATTNDANDLRCPGNPGGANANHAKLFGGASGKFLGPPPPLFNNWRYYNGTNGIFIMISSTKSDAYIQAALTRLDGMYSNCEADVYNRLGTTAVNVSSDIVPPGSGAIMTCAANTICFRYWIKRNSSAVPTDTNCN